MSLAMLCGSLYSLFPASQNQKALPSGKQLHNLFCVGTMALEKEKPSRPVAMRIAAPGREAVFDHISDHRPARSTWKRWRQEVQKPGDIGAESMGKGRKELEKMFLRPLGPGCREFESRHSDQNRQFSVRKLAVLTFSKVFSLFMGRELPCIRNIRTLR